MKCKAEKKSGGNCNATAMVGKEYCYLHNPEVPFEEKKDAQSKGGKANKAKMQLPFADEVELNNGKDVMLLIGKLTNGVLRNEVDLNLAKGVTYMLSYLLKAYEVSELENRVEGLENKLRK